jgi:5'-nucleotidase
MINTIIKNHNEYKGMVININFPDIDESEYKGIKGTAISKRGIPAKPIPIKKNNGLRFRYNYSGEPLSEDHETDAQAVKDGFVSVSALDYSLNSRNSIDNLSNIFNE